MVRDPWYIIGGGPSLRGFDWALLEGRQVIAINRAYEMLPNATVVYFTDARFWEWHRSNLLDHLGRLITSASKQVKHPRVELYRLTGTEGIDETPGCLRHGNNSGFAAINLAYHLGARHVYLFGYDFCYGAEGESHWHSGHPTLHRERVFEKMLPHAEALAVDATRLGLRVWNTNPTSQLRVFPFCTPQDALEDAGSVPALSYSLSAGTWPSSRTS